MAKKLTQEQYIENIQKKHRDKYDLSKLIYVNAKTKIVVICPEHGEFEIRPDHFRHGVGCPKCAGRGLTTEEWIVKAERTHGKEYSYTKVNFIGNNIPVLIYHSKCGTWFEQAPYSHINGCGCPKCNGGIAIGTEEWIRRAKEEHGEEFDYSKVIYKGAHEKVCIIHKKCGEEFWQMATTHMERGGCPVCSGRKEYKEFGYWNIKENCIEEAKKYRNKYELQKKCFGAYNGAFRNGWLDEIGDLYDNTILYKNYEERIHIVYGYFDVDNMVCYIGRTTDLKRRHNAHKNGTKHSNGKHYFDTVVKYFIGKNIPFPDPVVLEENLNAVESQEGEDKWLKHYRNNGWVVLNKAKTGIGRGSLGATVKWDYEACKEEAKKYNSKHEMKLNNQSAYSSSVRNGWIDEFFTQIKKVNGYWNNLELCIKESRKYRNSREFIKGSGGAYNMVRKNGWIKYMEYNKTPKTKNISEQFLKTIGIEKFKNKIGDFDLEFVIGNTVIMLHENGAQARLFRTEPHTYHLDKTKLCQEYGYKLIHIFEDEWINNREIVENKLLHIVGKQNDLPKIYARKCVIRKIDRTAAELFLNKYHIQGFVTSTIYLGAFYNDLLVGVMLFKEEEKDSDYWELTRFASDYNYVCSGLGGKLFSYFVKTYNPRNIKSFADRRWTVDADENIYTKLGFRLTNVLKPEYKYYNPSVDKYQRFHKFGFRKQTLHKKYGFPLTMTETEMTRELGYDRIWDCGLFKYEWTNNLEN